MPGRVTLGEPNVGWDAIVLDMAGLKDEVVTYYRSHDSASRYTAGAADRHEHFEAFHRRYKRYIGRTVVDLACGGGVLGFVLERHGRRYTGVDINPDMIREARAHARKTGSRATFVRGDLATVKLQGRFATATLVGNSLCHIDGRRLLAILEHLRPKMRAGSHFIVDYRDVVGLLYAGQWLMHSEQRYDDRIVDVRTDGCDTVRGRLEQAYNIVGEPQAHRWGHAIWSPFIIEPLFAASGWKLRKRREEPWSGYTDVYQKV